VNDGFLCHNKQQSKQYIFLLKNKLFDVRKVAEIGAICEEFELQVISSLSWQRDKIEGKTE
jgi:hypothetical protein